MTFFYALNLNQKTEFRIQKLASVFFRKGENLFLGNESLEN